MNKNITPVVKWLIITNIAIFVLQNIPSISNILYANFTLQPTLVLGKGYVWQILTYAFLHAGIYHLVFNMLGLYMFGTDVEKN